MQLTDIINYKVSSRWFRMHRRAAVLKVLSKDLETFPFPAKDLCKACVRSMVQNGHSECYMEDEKKKKKGRWPMEEE